MRRLFVLAALAGCEPGDDVAEGAPLEELAKKNEINVDVWDWMFTTGVGQATLGGSVSSAGDVNGDGFDDLAAGADGWSDSVTEDDEGAAFVFHGSVAGPSKVPDWQYESDDAGAGLGQSVASAGDVNGDGYDDLVVGETIGTNGIVSGKVHLFYGSPAGLAVQPDWTAEDGVDKSFGFRVASAGDINADGFADVLVGAESDPAPSPEFLEGAVYVYTGSATGLSAVPVATLRLRRNDVVVEAQVCKVRDDFEDDRFGASVARAGDVDGDGFDDIVVGAPGVLSDVASPFGFEGIVALYYGAPNGFRKPPTFLVPDEFHWRVGGSGSPADFGESAASAGDVNGDGFVDIVVGAPDADLDDRTIDVGAAYLFLGSAAGMSSLPAQEVNGHQQFSEFGISVASWGDANGDGLDDVIVGDSDFGSAAAWDLGAVFRFDGTATGWNADPTFLSTGKAVTAVGNGPSLGISVAPAGDVDGDGVPDIVVGGHTFSTQPTNASGAVFWLHGD